MENVFCEVPATCCLRKATALQCLKAAIALASRAGRLTSLLMTLATSAWFIFEHPSHGLSMLQANCLVRYMSFRFSTQGSMRAMESPALSVGRLCFHDKMKLGGASFDCDYSCSISRTGQRHLESRKYRDDCIQHTSKGEVRLSVTLAKYIG